MDTKAEKSRVVRPRTGSRRRQARSIITPGSPAAIKGRKKKMTREADKTGENLRDFPRLPLVGLEV